MTLTRPDFRLDRPNPSDLATDAEWWLWLRLHELEPTTQLGGIYADKSGFHNTGARNKARWPGNYSIRDTVNQVGPGWTHASALDWTFPDAQAGRYATIDRYTSRLMASAKNPDDPRLDLILFEFFGQADSDRQVEGWNEYREEAVSSDPSHLWHLHLSFLRAMCGSFWGMWALLTVLMGWSVSRWRASLPQSPPPIARKVTMISIDGKLPVLKHGDRDPVPGVQTLYITRVQRLLGAGVDGIYLGDTAAAVKALMKDDPKRSSPDGEIVGEPEWRRLYGIW